MQKGIKTFSIVVHAIGLIHFNLAHPRFKREFKHFYNLTLNGRSSKERPLFLPTYRAADMLPVRIFYFFLLNDYLHKPLHFCLLVPCYNDEQGLVQALKTVEYSFAHCLAVVVDDGSTQPLHAQQIEAQVATGLEVQVIRLEQNRGITVALNAGLDWIVVNTQAPYIARLDCRDLCHPQRFSRQVLFLNDHEQVGLLGTWCRFKEESTGIAYEYTTPVAHEAIKKEMPLRNVFIHPTVMFRSGFVRQGEKYPEDYPHAEDYAFCWRLLQLAEGAILPDYLVTCAITRNGISYRNRRQQLQSRKKVIKAFAPGTWINKKALIKINLLMVTPKNVLLRLKGLKNKGSQKLND